MTNRGNLSMLNGANSIDDVRKFQQSLKALDYEYKSIGYTKDNEIINQDKVDNYQYQSLWEPPPLSNKQMKAIDNYTYAPPYGCEQSPPINDTRTSKQVNNNTSSQAPWLSTDVQIPIKKRNYYPQANKKTEIWETSNTTTSSSLDTNNDHNSDPPIGDPIVNNLRKQLSKHGANGILSISKKFRIIDDDNSGSLDQNEFIKAMKECDAIDLSARAMNHLFSYLGKIILVFIIIKVCMYPQCMYVNVCCTLSAKLLMLYTYSTHVYRYSPYTISYVLYIPLYTYYVHIYRYGRFRHYII